MHKYQTQIEPKMPSKNARTFSITVNNPIEDAGNPDAVQKYVEGIHQKLGARYTCGQLEKGESGTLHVQLATNFKDPVGFTKIKRVLPRAHIEKAKSEGALIKYCLKEETRVLGPFEFGVLPVRHNEKKDWDEVWEMARNNQLEKIDKSILIPHYSQLRSIAKDHMEFPHLDATNLPEVKGVWMWGPTGVGKSTRAHLENPQAYPKNSKNVWWDGFQGQEVVIMDDVNLDDVKNHWSNYMKWADIIPHTLQIKGGAVINSFKKLIVTSNYSMNQVLEMVPENSRMAFKRRWRIIECPLKLY